MFFFVNYSMGAKRLSRPQPCTAHLYYSSSLPPPQYLNPQPSPDGETHTIRRSSPSRTKLCPPLGLEMTFEEPHFFYKIWFKLITGSNRTPTATRYRAIREVEIPNHLPRG